MNKSSISRLSGTYLARFLGIQGGIISNREELLEQGVQAGLRSLLLMEDNTSISDIARLVANSLGKTHKVLKTTTLWCLI